MTSLLDDAHEVEHHHIREYLGRPWRAIEQLKDEHRAAMNQRRGGRAALTAGHALYRHARLVQPAFPSADYLERDHAHHVQLKSLLDQVAHALPVRRATG